MTATWTTISDQIANTTVTAARLNALRDNCDWLKTPPSTRVLPATDQAVTSLSFVDLFSGLTLTTKGGAIMLIGHVSCQVGAGQSAYIDIVLDGVSLTGTSWGISRLSSGGVYQAVPIVWVTAALTAAAHTIKLQAKVSGGTTTFYGAAGSTQPFLYAREV